MRICLFIILCVFMMGCEEKTPIASELNETIETIENKDDKLLSLRGFSLSPESFTDESMKDFLLKMESFDILRWAGSITEFDQAPLVMSEFRKTNSFQILISTNLFEPGENYKALIDDRIASIENYAKEHHPEFLELGVEINSKFSDDVKMISAYAKYFNEAYRKVKTVSPETQVIATFQYEWLLGLRDGLFGGVKSEPIWSYLEMFETDIIGFTTYPCLYYADPWEIPRDYYSQIKNHTSKPIAFTEIGWYSDDSIENWESSEEEQARFIQRYFELTETVDPLVEVWSFMYEIFDQVPFKTMSLAGKKGFNNWKQGIGLQTKIKPVYFISRADHEAGEIYSLTSDGYIERLTFNNRHENNLALSFDGRQIAYHGGDEKDILSYEIYTMDLETLEEKQMTDNNVLDGHPDWFPDGQIIFASFVKDGKPYEFADLFKIDPLTLELSQLTDNEFEDNDPEVSPDGQWIVFKSTRASKEAFREEIFIQSLEDGSVRQLTDVSSYQSDHDPSWSQDSSQIVFERFEGQRNWVDIAKLDILMNELDSLTPWNNYRVDLEGNIDQLTDLDKGQIAFLPVFNGEDILYILMNFLLDNGQVIGADKQMLKQDPVTLDSIQYLFDTKHRYTLEYFDW